MIEQEFISILGKKICMVHVYPEVQSKNNILFIGGFCQNKAGYFCMNIRMAKFLAEQGYSCVLFDYPGIGDSDGDLQDYSWNDYVSITRKIAKNQLTKAYDVIIGFGFGANIATQIDTKEIIRIVGVSNWIDKYPLLPASMKCKDEEIALYDLFEDPFSNNLLRLLGGNKHYVRGFIAKTVLFREVAADPSFYDLIGDRKALLVYGEHDITQKVKKHIKLVEELVLRGVTLEVIQGADRFFSFADWQDEVFEAIIRWLEHI